MLRRGILVLVMACSPTPPGARPPAVDAGVDGAITPPTPNANVRFRGTLSSTETVRFGGAPYCNYSVTLRNVVVDLVMRETGTLAKNIVTDTVVEAVVGSCPYAASAPSDQVFEYPGGTIAEGPMFEVMLEGRASNRPVTAVTVGITVPASEPPRASIHWKRTDQGPPLEWQVRAEGLPLQPVQCAAGASVCVGVDHGTLYTCDDGVRLVEATRCPRGCASATACS